MKTNTVVLTLLGTLCVFSLTYCNPGKKVKKMDTDVNISNGNIQSSFYAKPDESINFKEAQDQFRKYPERWNTAFKFLTTSDLKQLTLGRINLSDDVYATISEYETKNPEDANFESHRKYIDLQYIVSGKEMIGLTNDTGLHVISSYDETKDIAFYDFNGGKLLFASPAHYFIFFPQDRHKPCLKIGEQDKVRKIVVKIKYD